MHLLLEIDAGARHVAARVPDRHVEKAYLAIVRGALDEQLVIDAPIGLANRRVRVQMAMRADGLPSQTRVRPLERYRGLTLVEARPETGRQHQIRVHLAHAGLPIVGDKLYPDDAPLSHRALRRDPGGQA